MEIIIALVLCLFLSFAFTQLSWLLIPRPIPGIPYNTSSAWLPWGDLPSLAIHNFRTRQVFDWFDGQCIKHNSTMVQLFLPNYSTKHPIIIFSDLHEIKETLLRKGNVLDRASLMHDFFALLYPRATVGLKTTPHFKEQRQLWNRILLPTFLADTTAPSCYHAAQELVELWHRKTQFANVMPFAVGEDLRQVYLDTIYEMLFGDSLGIIQAQIASLDQVGGKNMKRKSFNVVFETQLPPLYTALQTLFFYLDLVVQGVSPVVYTWLFQRLPSFKRARAVVDKTMAVSLAAARVRTQAREAEVPGSRMCGLEKVLVESSLKDPIGDSCISADAALKDELLELLVTGHETTAATTGWALKYLTDNPASQTALRDALAAAYPDLAPSCKVPSCSAILETSVPYLDAVIAETFRLSSTGPVAFRQASVETQIQGHLVPAQTPVILITGGPSHGHFLSSNDFHRASKSESTARQQLEQFDPRRWLQITSNLGKSDTEPYTKDFITVNFDPKAVPILPFSAGIRGCFGKKIAMLQLKIMLTVLFLSFEFHRLEHGLSGYHSRDGLTRQPISCYVKLTSLST